MFTARDRQRASIAWARVLSRDVVDAEGCEITNECYLTELLLAHSFLEVESVEAARE